MRLREDQRIPVRVPGGPGYILPGGGATVPGNVSTPAKVSGEKRENIFTAGKI